MSTPHAAWLTPSRRRIVTKMDFKILFFISLMLFFCSYDDAIEAIDVIDVIAAIVAIGAIDAIGYIVVFSVVLSLVAVG